MITQSFTNVTNIAMFGYGAKTSSYTKTASQLFPISKNLRNPFLPNDPATLQALFSDCVDALE
jgi:hypothetical protein